MFSVFVCRYVVPWALWSIDMGYELHEDTAKAKGTTEIPLFRGILEYSNPPYFEYRGRATWH